MTNSLYTHHHPPNNKNIKKENERSEYMDINADEAEAGSILMSLSQQTKKPKETSTNNTMSIQNLLGAEEQIETKQTKVLL
ncbi:hypothetical protein BJ944DRAFT_30307 [Cunninghamella echinulata]|nr:hypothetical protein BJ944DRAFT_30307 [Cunninghamella echinulata]